MSFHPTFFGKNLDQALWNAASELQKEPWNIEYRMSTVDGGFVMVEVLNVPLIETAPVIPKPSRREEAAVAEPVRVTAGDVPGVPVDVPFPEAVRTVLTELTTRIGIAGALSVEEQGDVINVDLGPEHVDTLHSQQGRLLDSLQHLVNRMVHQQHGGGPAIRLDAMGQVASRESMLESMAHRLADLAVVAGGAINVETLPAAQRRTIHNALARRNDVRTESDGQGAFRRLIIKPA